MLFTSIKWQRWCQEVAETEDCQQRNQWWSLDNSQGKPISRCSLKALRVLLRHSLMALRALSRHSLTAPERSRGIVWWPRERSWGIVLRPRERSRGQQKCLESKSKLAIAPMPYQAGKAHLEASFDSLESALKAFLLAPRALSGHSLMASKALLRPSNCTSRWAFPDW